MVKNGRALWTVVTVGCLLAAAVLVGLVLRRSSSSEAGTAATTTEYEVVAKPDASSGSASGAGAQSGGVETAASSVPPPRVESAGSPDRFLVVNATVDMRVRDIRGAIVAIRSATVAMGGSISFLSVGNGPNPPEASSTDGINGSSRDPSIATVTVRVPAASLPACEERIVRLGDVVAQGLSESDVTQQHVDMSARLNNLKAEESQLRSLFDRAGSVSSMLAVEHELARVRGDIESMQAQLAYLERQAAMATLTISLTQPGPLVRPSRTTWGFADSFTLGVQSAAAILRALITGGIATLPLTLLALLGWVAVRLRRARRRRRSLTAPAEA